MSQQFAINAVVFTNVPSQVIGGRTTKKVPAIVVDYVDGDYFVFTGESTVLSRAAWMRPAKVKSVVQKLLSRHQAHPLVPVLLAKGIDG
jgi:hypothetical protein